MELCACRSSAISHQRRCDRNGTCRPWSQAPRRNPHRYADGACGRGRLSPFFDQISARLLSKRLYRRSLSRGGQVERYTTISRYSPIAPFFATLLELACFFPLRGVHVANIT